MKNIAYLKQYTCMSNDIEKYYQYLKGYQFYFKTDILGLIDLDKKVNYTNCLYLYSPRTFIKEEAPNILLMAGTHGEEFAGVWGILSYLNYFFETYKTVGVPFNLSFVPIVNPTGFIEGTRLNNRAEDSEWGYRNIFDLTTEGTMLKDSWKVLSFLAADGFLNLHEDIWEQKGFYIYAFEKTPLIKELKDTGKQYFPLKKDGLITGDAGTVRSGVIFNHHDGSPEDAFNSDNIKNAVCTETPAFEDPQKRITCNAELINTFITHITTPYYENKINAYKEVNFKSI